MRPLARTHTGKVIAATPPDRRGSFEDDGHTIRLESWHDLTTAETKVAQIKRTFSLYVFYDPRYETPLVVATDVELKPRSIFQIYGDRWPVEQPPLAAKQMIGLHRQFVSAPECCFRLPELALLAGNILSYVAAVSPPIPSGFWDRKPHATPGRLRRLLAQTDFPEFGLFDERYRKKAACHAHLPKGVAGHRRQKAAA